MLDIGCGAGQTLIAAYPDRVSYGIDIDDGALKLDKRLTGRVRFAQSRAEALPYHHSQFDLVISRVAMPYTNIQSTLKEIRRVLKPGGELWATLPSFPMAMRNRDLKALRTHLSLAYVIANSALFHLAQRQFQVMGKCESFQTPAGIRRALEQNGFEDIVVSQGTHFLVEALVPGLTLVPEATEVDEQLEPVLTIPGGPSSEAA